MLLPFESLKLKKLILGEPKNSFDLIHDKSAF